jgi:hypothetical protein
MKPTALIADQPARYQCHDRGGARRRGRPAALRRLMEHERDLMRAAEEARRAARSRNFF